MIIHRKPKLTEAQRARKKILVATFAVLFCLGLIAVVARFTKTEFGPDPLMKQVYLMISGFIMLVSSALTVSKAQGEDRQRKALVRFWLSCAGVLAGAIVGLVLLGRQGDFAGTAIVCGAGAILLILVAVPQTLGKLA